MTASSRLRRRLPGFAPALVFAALASVALAPIALAQEPDAGATPAEIRYSPNGADTCLICHMANRTVLEIFKTKHGVPTDPHAPFGQGGLQCEACHGPGGVHAGRVPRGEERPPVIRFTADSITPVAEQNSMCLGCHDADVGFGWHAGPHERNDVACASCHTIHAARDPVLATATQADVCYTCHQTVRTATLKPYAHPLRSGKMSCTGCHSPHGATEDLQLARQTLNDTCYQCHAEKRGPFLWEHAPVAEDCSICHVPHGSNYPAMLAQRPPFLCQSCHSQAGHPSIAQTPDGLAAGAPSAYLLGQSCLNCHSQVHGSNHPSGSRLMR
jgi:DmsE family decaheme c-type cytochrome